MRFHTVAAGFLFVAACTPGSEIGQAPNSTLRAPDRTIRP